MKTKQFMLVAVASALLATGTAFGQSNDQGVFQVGLGWGLTFGGAKITNKDTTGEIKADGTGAKANYGLRVQYGFNEKFSGGIYFRGEAATYVVTSADLTSGLEVPDITYSGTAVGLEGKYYVVNEDNFNFYPALSLGYTGGSNEISDITFGDSKTSLSGYNYSLGVGFNWYFFNDMFGLSMDLNYQGTHLGGTRDATDYSPQADVTVNNSGLMWGLGLTARFGGN